MDIVKGERFQERKIVQHEKHDCKQHASRLKKKSYMNVSVNSNKSKAHLWFICLQQVQGKNIEGLPDLSSAWWETFTSLHSELMSFSSGTRNRTMCSLWLRGIVLGLLVSVIKLDIINAYISERKKQVSLFSFYNCPYRKR